METQVRNGRDLRVFSVTLFMHRVSAVLLGKTWWESEVRRKNLSRLSSSLFGAWKRALHTFLQKVGSHSDRRVHVTGIRQRKLTQVAAMLSRERLLR